MFKAPKRFAAVVQVLIDINKLISSFGRNKRPLVTRPTLNTKKTSSVKTLVNLSHKNVKAEIC